MITLVTVLNFCFFGNYLINSQRGVTSLYNLDVIGPKWGHRSDLIPNLDDIGSKWGHRSDLVPSVTQKQVTAVTWTPRYKINAVTPVIASRFILTR